VEVRMHPGYIGRLAMKAMKVVMHIRRRGGEARHVISLQPCTKSQLLRSKYEVTSMKTREL
jgi:hypothetical protein